MKLFNYVIYHRHCFDGFGGFYAFYKAHSYTNRNFLFFEEKKLSLKRHANLFVVILLYTMYYIYAILYPILCLWGFACFAFFKFQDFRYSAVCELHAMRI